jgi:hypothetical protein
MNTPSQWRISLARQIAPAYTVHPHVQAVILGASAARGYADSYADLELGVFWSHPQTEHEREQAVIRANGTNLTIDPYDPTREWCIVPSHPPINSLSMSSSTMTRHSINTC